MDLSDMTFIILMMILPKVLLTTVDLGDPETG